ncbi:hypothetical protein LHV13_07790 [Ferrovum sp. PN-J185]|uniref:hypothetical protein n=1 Tax=Ferrovum sp. PN-J185 TaxID=1356306 RepID=UPI000792E20B|nr:hypothetical protein [Ferrovum sp. PN-J185]KXW56347.1 cofactor-independent phosphoglycerate mutase [Ferrovum sp. PN-J185]MCC6069071.1 hypothetical protein [Ferrovum sp. PN-J185]MDE1890949.1 hypothetical protein [Betaproteobacteria bacterium]MDE2055739.1 hypothetical protein [Betaproteobacteria bacterium]
MNHHPIYIVPGLIPERFTGEIPRLPHLEKLLANADIRSLSKRINKEQFSHSPPHTSLAQSKAEKAGIRSRYTHWLLASPIHLHIEGDGLVLMDHHTFPITMEESQALVNIFNNHFLVDHIEFFIINNNQWLIGSQQEVIKHSTYPLDRAGRTISDYLPQGENAAFWRQVFNEAQMLCHDHSVNLQRQDKGQKPISGVWFWDSLTQFSINQYEIIDSLEAPAAYGDWEKWTKELVLLDNSLFRDLLLFLKKSNQIIQLFATDHPNSREIRLHPISPWYFWRRPKPLSHLI